MSVKDLIKDITAKNFTNAEQHFTTIMHDKISDALESEKAAVAGSIFNDAEQLELDLDDEDLEDLEDDYDDEESDEDE